MKSEELDERSEVKMYKFVEDVSGEMNQFSSINPQRLEDQARFETKQIESIVELNEGEDDQECSKVLTEDSPFKNTSDLY